MIDELLARLRDWRDNRDRAEAKDLARRERRLAWAVERFHAKRDTYEREWQTAAAVARRDHLTACGVTFEEWMPGMPRYRKDGKLLWDCDLRALGYGTPPDYAPPQLTESVAMDIQELALTRLQIQGCSRERAEELQAKREALDKDMAEWAKQPSALVGYQYRPDWRDPEPPKHAIADRAGRLIPCGTDYPTHNGRKEYREPSADEIVALGPA
jgi:hypothetical protein